MNHKSSAIVMKKKKIWPAIASVAAVFLVAIISSTFLNNTIINQDRSNEMESARIMDGNSSLQRDQKSAGAGNSESEAAENNFVQESVPDIQSENQPITYTAPQNQAVYATDVQEDELVLTFGIPDEQAMNVVPVSVIVKKEAGKTWLDLYNEVANILDEQQLGLSNYLPYKGTLSLEDDQTLKLDLPPDHQYGWGAAGETMFLKSLSMFKFHNIDKVLLFTDLEPGVEFGNTGIKNDLTIAKNSHYGYEVFLTNNQLYLYPTYSEYDSVGEAFEEMKTENEYPDENDKLSPSIPESVSFTFSEEDSNLNIQFSDETTLENTSEMERMIEAILLTAKDFGYATVSFNNTKISEIGKFQFNNPIEVPLAPNLVGEVE